MAHKQQKDAALALLKRASEPVKLTTIGHRIGDIPHRTLRRWLNHWIDSGVVKKTGQGRTTFYQYNEHIPDPKTGFVFLNGLDNDLQLALLNQLRDLWTYNSSAIEGNTLTLGDTHFVLEQGLTISGKPLKDHQETIGHATAIELLYKSLLQPLTDIFIFELHKTVVTNTVNDIYKPMGQWKIETNGSYAVIGDGTQTFIEYALPQHVPQLMSQLIAYVNSININVLTIDNAHEYYAKIHMCFVHIHPFWDGNGRLARLIANIPLLKAGLPPLVIPQDQRREYIQILADYQIKVGQLTKTSTVWPDVNQLQSFNTFCNSVYSTTKSLVENIIKVQQKRKHK